MKKSDYDTEIIWRFIKNTRDYYGPKILSEVLGIMGHMGANDEFIPKNVVKEAIKRCPEESKRYDSTLKLM